jgi:hypothetical protein
MYFADHLTLDAPRRTKDGFLAVRARAARTGVYQYSGREVDPDNKHGLRDKASVNVLRDDGTVFDERAVRSFIGKPVTDDHPHEAVTRDNWRDHARGTIMGAMRDGDYLAFDLLLTDGPTIDKVESGKRELSNGYGADIEFGDFKAADGTACQARQSKITGGNHVALVDRGRAGPDCRIADAFAICDANPEAVARLSATPTGDIPMKTLTIDGLRVPNVSDEAEAAITKLQDQLAKANEAKDKALADVSALQTDKATLETEKTTLEKKLKDAEVTPQQLRDAAKSYALTVDKAKALGVAVTDEMSEADIRKAVVSAKMGDAAKDWDDKQIAASFAVLAKDAKVETHTAPSGQPVNLGDADKAATDARAKMIADMLNPAAANA